MSKSGFRGILGPGAIFGIIVLILSITVFILVFNVPWLSMWRADDPGEPYEYFGSYDIDGEWDDQALNSQALYEKYPSLESGKFIGFGGLILAIITAIVMIVLGNLPLKDRSNQRLLLFFRSAMSLPLITSGVLMMYCGSQWGGYAITISSLEVVMYFVPFSPMFIGGLGLIVFILGIVLLNFQTNRLRRLAPNPGRVQADDKERSVKGFKAFSIAFVIQICATLIFLDLFPILVGGEANTTNYYSTSFFHFFEMTYEADLTGSLYYFELMLWLMLAVALFNIIAMLLLESDFSDTAGYILSLCTNFIAPLIVLASIFKLALIIDIYDFDALDDVWYGWNYLPALGLVSLFVTQIYFMVFSIKRTHHHFKFVRPELVKKARKKKEKEKEYNWYMYYYSRPPPGWVEDDDDSQDDDEWFDAEVDEEEVKYPKRDRDFHKRKYKPEEKYDDDLDWLDDDEPKKIAKGSRKSDRKRSKSKPEQRSNRSKQRGKKNSRLKDRRPSGRDRSRSRGKRNRQKNRNDDLQEF